MTCDHKLWHRNIKSMEDPETLVLNFAHDKRPTHTHTEMGTNKETFVIVSIRFQGHGQTR